MGPINFELGAPAQVGVDFNVTVRQSGGGGGGSGGGGIQSAQIDEIRVLTKSEYDALTAKDARTLYLVEG